jgi:hypothetical protein
MPIYRIKGLSEVQLKNYGLNTSLVAALENLSSIIKFSAMQRPLIKPVWSEWTSSGTKGGSLRVIPLVQILVMQFWREIAL